MNKPSYYFYRIVSIKRPGGVAIFQKGDVYKRQVFNAKMQLGHSMSNQPKS